ncbi:MAG: DNA replication/repair protein RecF [Rubellimicrobium sp.]|nr:DNA replication/repair protein RecF [Rubellimicrobium sp.]
MSAITHLVLSHFRSHRAQRLVFDGRPVVLTGPNGAGKTNLIEAISLLSPGRGLRGAGAEDLARRPEAIGWKIAADLFGHEVETRAEPGEGRGVRIDGKAAPQVALARLGAVQWLVPAMDRLWIEGAEGRRRLLDRMTMGLIPDHAEAVLDYDRAMRDRNRLLRDMVRDGHWHGALEAQMARTGVAITANRRQALGALVAAQADAGSVFPAADLTLTHAEGDPPADEAALAEAFARGRARDMAAGRTLIGPHRADLAAVWAEKGMAAAVCSTGEQKALLISLILANARAIARHAGRPPVLLLDEVAAHLDEGRRAALYDEICALGGQAFMTGTEPDLFAGLGQRAQHWTLSESPNGSVMHERPAP